MPSFRNDDDVEAYALREGHVAADSYHFCTLLEAAPVPQGIHCDQCHRHVYIALVCNGCGGGLCQLCNGRAIAKRIAACVERIGLQVKGVLVNE